MSVNLKIKIKNIEFQNPVFTASGTFGYGEEYADVFNINKLGAIVTKGLTFHERQGNEGIRIHEVPCGMINRIGLQNVGVKNFIREKIPFLKKCQSKIIINIAGFSFEEFVKIIEYLNPYKFIAGYEINVSCPNVKKGGIEFSTDIKLFSNLLKTVRKRTDKLLIVKLSPQAGNIVEFAQIARICKMDAITVANTFKSTIIDINKQKILIKGGLSGPVVFPLILNLVMEIRKKVKLPIIASGGIFNTDTAIQYLLAGACALQIGTYNFVDPLISLKIIDGIKNYLKKHKIKDIKNIIGKVQI